MTDPILRIGRALGALAWATRAFRTGAVQIETNGPPRLFLRSGKPLACWSFAAFLYGTLATMVVALLFLP